MRLRWGIYGDTGRTAEGDKGTWHVVYDGRWWWLTIEPPHTRGRLHQGKFVSRDRAQQVAQEREDDIPIYAQ